MHSFPAAGKLAPVEKIVAIIPARMESTRFPGKPLAKICGHSMIEHVLRRTQLSKTLTDVVVATCNEEIARQKFIVTSGNHTSCMLSALAASSRAEKTFVTAPFPVCVGTKSQTNLLGFFTARKIACFARRDPRGCG